MKKREREFCRLMAVYAQPVRAAREAGYRDPADAWQQLLCRRDIADEIHRNTAVMSEVVRDTALSGVYRLAFGGVSDAVRLLYHDQLSDDQLDRLNLSCVSEIKRSKDKSIEIKFFDRVKALDKLKDHFDSDSESHSSGGLLDAIRLSAQALGRTSPAQGEDDEL